MKKLMKMLDFFGRLDGSETETVKPSWPNKSSRVYHCHYCVNLYGIHDTITFLLH